MSTMLINDYTWWMTPEQKQAYEATQRAADKAEAKFERRIRKAIEEASPLVAGRHMGNGRVMFDIFQRAMLESGAWNPAPQSTAYKKATIGRSLSKAVFERDGYRCVLCSSHVDLTCDHIIAEREGGPTTIDNLQTMCRTCNCKKGRNSFSALKRNAA